VETAFRGWLEHLTGDRVVAGLALRVIKMHAELIVWTREAEAAHLQQLAQPQRRHAGDPRDRWRGMVGRGGHGDPDDPMIALISHREQVGGDPEHLEPTRQRLTHLLAKEALWYGDRAGFVEDADWWGPVADRLGRFIGDQVAANHLAFSLVRHRRLAITPYEEIRRHHRAAIQRWRRLEVRYLQALGAIPDERPERRARVESVGLDGERVVG
jgi:hypothetical protein